MKGLPDQGRVVMLGERAGRGEARRRGRKGSRRRHLKGEKMGHQGEKRSRQGEKRRHLKGEKKVDHQVPKQVLESSGSRESCWQRKQIAGADLSWQVSPQRKEVCGGVAVVVVVVVVLVSLCDVPQSCTTGRKSHRCQTKFCTGAVVTLSQLP